jgi:hypothetical protein
MADPRDNNPHSLRPHQSTVMKRGLCSCCELPFKVKPTAPARAYCDECRSHYEIVGESAERHEERLTVDRRRVGEFYQQMRLVLNRTEGELATAKTRISSALRSRDHWKGIVDKVQAIHHPRIDGTCRCGEKSCAVMRIVGDLDTTVRERW